MVFHHPRDGEENGLGSGLSHGSRGGYDGSEVEGGVEEGIEEELESILSARASEETRNEAPIATASAAEPRATSMQALAGLIKKMLDKRWKEQDQKMREGERL